MNDPQKLLTRMHAIGASLAQTGQALALIGLGSVGEEIYRLDEYSDLDFFVIVKPHTKSGFLENLSWLTGISPVEWYFQNTPDGYKFLFSDGIFCEFAVFEEKELREAVFAPGRIYWKAEGVDDSIRIPVHTSPRKEDASVDWLLGEALSNLYIGLLRDMRGEKISAMRFIQGYAVDRVLELMERSDGKNSIFRDPFSLERRFEQRHPGVDGILPGFLQGYGRNRESALALLEYLENHFKVDPAMCHRIKTLCSHSEKG